MAEVAIAFKTILTFFANKFKSVKVLKIKWEFNLLETFLEIARHPGWTNCHSLCDVSCLVIPVSLSQYQQSNNLIKILLGDWLTRQRNDRAAGEGLVAEQETQLEVSRIWGPRSLPVAHARSSHSTSAWPFARAQVFSSPSFSLLPCYLLCRLCSAKAT